MEEEKKVEEVSMENNAQEVVEKEAWKDVAAELAHLEGRELEATLKAEMYPQLMAAYVILFDFRNAQLFWKRCPAIKKEDKKSELAQVWKAAQSLWQKDYPAAYLVIKETQWSETMVTPAKKLHESIQNRAIELVSRAYFTIKLSSFAALLDKSEAEALKIAKSMSWEYDENSKILLPKKLNQAQESNGQMASLHSQLGNLTSYVSFLEN